MDHNGRSSQLLALLAAFAVPTSALRMPRRCLVQVAAGATIATASTANAVAYRTEVYSSPPTPGRSKPKCRDIESCQAEGERRAAEAEAKAGPLRNVGPLGANGMGRVRYRAMKETDDGPALREGDVAELRFDVLSTSGELMYGIPSREPGAAAAGVLDTYRMVLGRRDVPLGVELALEGAHKGDLRRIEVPPDLGFATSDWKPAPSGYSGKQRLEQYRARLTGNGLQPGYPASILFQVEVVKVRPATAP